MIEKKRGNEREKKRKINMIKQVPRGYIRCDYFIVTYCTIVFDVV